MHMHLHHSLETLSISENVEQHNTKTSIHYMQTPDASSHAVHVLRDGWLEPESPTCSVSFTLLAGR